MLKKDFDKFLSIKAKEQIWCNHIGKKAVISELRAALNYRHWLVHGRYWVFKRVTKYDFNGVLLLALYVQNELGIDMGAD